MKPTKVKFYTKDGKPIHFKAVKTMKPTKPKAKEAPKPEEKCKCKCHKILKQDSCVECWRKHSNLIVDEALFIPSFNPPAEVSGWEDRLKPKVEAIFEVQFPDDKEAVPILQNALDEYYEVLKPHIRQLLIQARQKEKQRIRELADRYQEELPKRKYRVAVEELINLIGD